MAIQLKQVMVDNFKSYQKEQWIDFSDLSIFMGANSSGKSTALQALLVIKQTMECESPNIDVLLSGKFVTLGDYSDIVNEPQRGFVRIGVSIDYRSEIGEEGKHPLIIWEISNQGAKGSPKVETIRIITGEEPVEVRHYKEKLYKIYVNDKDTGRLVDVNNLKFKGIYAEYDKYFNILFAEFLNKLGEALCPKKKINRVKKNQLVAIKGLEEFFFYLLRSNSEKDFDLKELKENKSIEKIASEINVLIDEFATLQLKNYKVYNRFPDLIKEYIFKLLLKEIGPGGEKQIGDIIKSYKGKLNEYNNNPNVEKENIIIERLDAELKSFREHIKGDEQEEEQIISEAFLLYEGFSTDVLGKLFYVGPIREKPQGLYNIGFESVPKYVGTTGAYFASVLLHQDQEQSFVLPNDEIAETNLLDALNQWVEHLDIASEINVEKRHSFGFSVSVENMQNKKADIMNVGIGTSQVLPVLITGLLSEKGETLIFEQPELHLHPFSQSRLGDFFVALAKNKRRLIVETHSEHMLLRLRYHVLAGKTSEDAIIVNFFQNKNGTKVKQGQINRYGELDYPDDFKDETQNLLSDLIFASMMRSDEK